MNHSILGREEETAKLLNVSLDIVKERERVLMRRDRIGRTGTFLKRDLREGESFEKVLKTLIDSNPAVRRVYSMRGRD